MKWLMPRIKPKFNEIPKQALTACSPEELERSRKQHLHYRKVELAEKILLAAMPQIMHARAKVHIAAAAC